MRRAALKQSELISSIGWLDGNLEIRYRDDGAVFVYFKVPYAIYLRLKASKTPGELWLQMRDHFGYERV
jgi:hypothetical protein